MLDIKRRYLLDVNVWIALVDKNHAFYPAAYAFMQTTGLKIAHNPIIENGVMRILNLPRYAGIGGLGFERVASQLQKIYALHDCAFWLDDVSLRDNAINWSRIHGHNQITDAYLLALAVKNDGCLATFDTAIAMSAVHGASSKHICIL